MKLGLVSVLLLATLSCSDSGPGRGSTLTFTYTGAGGGSFNASGDITDVTAPPTGISWAAGYLQANETYVAGSIPRSGGLVDLAVLRFERATVGVEGIDPSCDIDGSVACTSMAFFLNFSGDGDTGDFFCGLTNGAIVLDEVTNGRAKGTFSGTGTCVAGTGGASTQFSVTDGTFDVLLLAPPT